MNETVRGVDAAKTKILVVDDEPMVLQLVVDILQREGHVVLPANSGRRALEICKECKDEIRLVLSDLHMPEMSGQELADCIAEFPNPVPVIFMSGFLPDSPLLGDDPRRTGTVHSRYFIHKPFTARDLAQLVSIAMRES